MEVEKKRRACEGGGEPSPRQEEGPGVELAEERRSTERQNTTLPRQKRRGSAATGASSSR